VRPLERVPRDREAAFATIRARRRARRHLFLVLSATAACLLPLSIPALSAAIPVHLIGRDLVGSSGTDASFSASGCGEFGTVAIQLPPGARALRPDPLNEVGTYLFGPEGFRGKDVVGVEHYAQITSFAINESPLGPQGVFFASAVGPWCAGWTGRPSEQNPPTPAIEQTNPQQDPTYHAGWRTAPFLPIVDYVLDRTSLYSIDPKGHLRSVPPRTMSISRRFPLVAHDIRWRHWGYEQATGRGWLPFGGRSLTVNLQLYNAELGGDPQGLPRCPAGNTYYLDLGVAVPAWRLSTDYQIDQRCRNAYVDNGGGDVRPPR
jgi:hypothetical protein